jgi:probable HAF family extracellular repeat protein
MKPSLLISIIFISFNISFSQDPSLSWLGTLGGNSSHAYKVSANGSVVVGVSTTASYYERAFRWTSLNGMENLGTLGGNQSVANGVTDDGSIVVGWSRDAGDIKRAFKWTASGGMVDLGAGDWTEAVGISSDGSAVIVNNGMDGFAYRWTSSGLENLGTLGGNQSIAYDISSDGSVIVGFSYDSTNNPYAFRWVAGSGMAKIGTYYSFARGVSADGNTVTGSETGVAGLHRAFKWTTSGGFVFNIAGNFSYGLAASGDGSIIVGDGGDGAFRLTSANGLEYLAQIYSTLLNPGSELIDATDISPNGLFIVGNGTNSSTGLDEGYLIAVNGLSSADKNNTIASDFILEQNYPNPFNPITTITYYIPRASFVTLTIYNLLGQEVAQLVNEYRQPGRYDVPFDGSMLQSGVYYYKLTAGEFTQTKRMLLLK